MLVLYVEDTSCYWVRILEHRPGKADQTSSSTHIIDSTEFLELTMSVSGWYANPANRVKHELVSIGDLCAMMCGNSFQRYSCDLLLVYMHKEKLPPRVYDDDDDDDDSDNDNDNDDGDNNNNNKYLILILISNINNNKYLILISELY